MPTDGVYTSSVVDDEAVELGAVGCTSLIGAASAEGRRVRRLPEPCVELGAVGCRVVSGKPLDGTSDSLASWVLDS